MSVTQPFFHRLAAAEYGDRRVLEDLKNFRSLRVRERIRERQRLLLLRRIYYFFLRRASKLVMVLVVVGDLLLSTVRGLSHIITSSSLRCARGRRSIRRK